MSWEQDLHDWAEETKLPNPTPGQAAALVMRARARRNPVRRAAVWGIPVLAAAAALWLVFSPAPQPQVLTPIPPVAKAPETPQATPVQWLEPGRQAVGRDMVEVATDSQVQVVAQGKTTRLALATGSVRVEADKRSGGEQLQVTTGDWTVQVVGTAFEVDHAPFAVRVFSGVVDVLRGDKSWRLRANDRFEDGQVIRPPTPREPTSAPSLESIRAAIVGGDVDQARQALARRLDQHPNDTDSHTLLAQLETKAGNPSAATTHWRAVVTHGSPRAAQRAHYEIAILSVDTPTTAEHHLRQFLKQDSPLLADARLRLARALQAQGRTEPAQAELQRIVQDHPGTAPARIAREMLRDSP